MKALTKGSSARKGASEAIILREGSAEALRRSRRELRAGVLLVSQSGQSRVNLLSSMIHRRKHWVSK